MKYKLSILSSVIGAALVTGCGFESEQNVSDIEVTSLKGTFLDNTVAGINYRRTNINGEVIEGVTADDGTYDYVRGETIEFYVGEVSLPIVPAKSIITPLSFFKTDNPHAENVANVARFLQSLDSDADPSNGISIYASAAAVAKVNNDSNGQPLTADAFFSQSADSFAAAVETWLAQATDNTRSKLVSYDEAIEHFVGVLGSELGEYKPQAFDPALLTGEISNVFADKGMVNVQVFTFTPDEEGASAGQFSLTQADDAVVSGRYQLNSSRQVLTLQEIAADQVVNSHYFVSLASNSDQTEYSLCYASQDDLATGTGIQTLISQCETENEQRINKFVLNSDAVATTVEAMTEIASTIGLPEPALLEEFELSSVNEFFSSNYKRLGESLSSGALYFKTGGTIELVDGQLVLAGDRFSIGNTTPDVATTSADTKGTGIYNLSEGFTISFDVIDHGGAGSLNIYADNNTTSSGNSMHGGDSKFIGLSINDENLPKGQRFEYSHPGFAATTNSFLQLRTDSKGSITIDNLRIETVAGEVVKEAYEPQTFSCSNEPSLYFCDDFASGSLDNWDIFATDGNTSGPEGVFDVLDANGNQVMRYTAGSLGGVLTTVKDSALANVPDGDYFVEAKIRPRQNGTTASKHLYLLGRYVDAQNWYAGGLNMQNSPASTQAEIATKIADSLSRPVQKKQAFVLGERDATDDGIWYTVRLSMSGSDLTLYVNGEEKGTYTDSNFTAKGLAGIYTYNRSFELDDFKIGAASEKPISIATDLNDNVLNAGVNGDSISFNVNALMGDGSAETVTVHSGDGDIAKVSIDGAVVTVTPLEEGQTTIYLVSSSDPSIYHPVDIVVAPQFVDSSTDYGDLSGKLTPAIDESSAYIDTLLTLEFDSAPTLGEKGLVRIFNASTNEMVDELNVAGDVDTITSERDDKFRTLQYQSVYVDGNKLVIKPHHGVLEYQTNYYVVIGNDVVVNTQLNGIDFDGLGSASMWSFTTKAIAPTGTNIIVDDNGTDADFRTLQGAMAYAMQDKNSAMTIWLRDGIYTELLYLRDKHNLTIQGESRDNTIVQYANYEGLNGGSSGRPVFLVEGSDNLVLNNFTLKNSHMRTGSGDQAETIYFNGPGRRLVANNMNFISEQDTLQLKGYVWIYNSLVSGNVDFIWGYPEAALFENSEIRTIGRSEKAPDDSEGGYILQARVQEDFKDNAGFVFLNNDFTSGVGPKGNGVLDNSTFIARSSGSDSYYDNVLLINNKLGSHINTSGWATQSTTGGEQPDPNPTQASATMGWREFASMDLTGSALDLTGRDPAASVLTTAPYSSRAEVFAKFGDAGWDPQPLAAPDFTQIPSDTPTVAAPAAGDGGFAGDSFTLNGGEGGTVVTVATGTALVAAIDSAKKANTALTIYVDGTITAANTGNTTRNIAIKDINNVSIIGVANRGKLSGIGFQIERAQNIIIRNLTIHEVPASFGDAIGIEGDDNTPTRHIWIDHNELYGSLTVGKDDYDGLIDSKAGASHITVSYNYIHDHWKTMLNGSSDDDAGDRFITYHHNYFANINSRVPLFRYGYGHLYNNYFYNIAGSAINSRMGAQLLIENNLFENVKNAIVSLASREKGYWYARGNSFVNVSYSSDSSFGSTEDSYSLSGDITGTYDDVPYDYSSHLLDINDVKAHVLTHAGVGKIDQSNDTIPALDGSGQPGGNDGSGNTGGTTGAVDLSQGLVEDFAAADTATFFSNAYKTSAKDTNTALYHSYNDGDKVENGQLTMANARLTIGSLDGYSADTNQTDQPNGLFDFSHGATISFKLVAVSSYDNSKGTADQNKEKSLQIYIDNNTTGSANSLHQGASRIFKKKVSELTDPNDNQVGQTITIKTDLGTATSFIQIRAEDGVEAVIDDLVITPTAPPVTNSVSEDFSATDSATFFSSSYAAQANDSSHALYVKTGGSVEITNGQLVLGGDKGGRFTIGDTLGMVNGNLEVVATNGNTNPTGVFDFSQGVIVTFDLIAIQQLDDADKSLIVYLDNNTSKSAESIHGGDSKKTVGKVALLSQNLGKQTIEFDIGTATSFIQLRTESNVVATIDNLVITAK
ncbi:pectate lyase (plasmid) [Saccharobesus litoralis]|uniref:Pectate lyase n=1 Tax=Saccharobesus litoralis TaxID=2172099 RepID=A0A2S0VYD9_9ALTE|nr:pectinesterase family protein [Saccharobesus litoralis]AWB69237.1 pectate lyase [Saccharobesus litoralis]